MEKFDKQVLEIKRLTEAIVKKSEAFAIKNANNQNFDDLTHVLEELRDIDKFIN
jgi:hypothetical protein